MPSALAITRSSGVVMNPRTRSALAPTYTVVTLITAMSLRGYWRTERARTDCRPAIRMIRFTTIASTGRLMNRSVKRILPVLDPWRGAVRWLNGVVNLHGGVVAQLEHARGHDLVAGVDPGQHRN